MSVIIDATYKGETFEVEISHDGSLEFLNYNIRHDQAAAEFGYPVTVAIELLDAWKRDATKVISRHGSISMKHLALLALDWAEHVADAYKVYGYDKRGGADRLVNILNSARHRIEPTGDNVSGENILNLETLARGAYDKIGEHPSEEAKYAARATYHAIMVLPEFKRQDEPVARIVASSAAECARSTSLDYLYLVLTENEEAAKKEELWQIRRFVDCMEAVGQGFDWPDMKVTP